MPFFYGDVSEAELRALMACHEPAIELVDAFPEELFPYSDIVASCEANAKRYLHKGIFEAYLKARVTDFESDEYQVLGSVGDHTLMLYYGILCDMVQSEVYSGYTIFTESLGSPSLTHLYLVTDDAIYTLSAAYQLGLIDDMGKVYDLLPADMQAGYDPSAEDSYGGMGMPVELIDGVYQ